LPEKGATPARHGATLAAQLAEAAAAIRSRTSLRPRIGLVLGSGLGGFADTLDGAKSIPFGEIPHFVASTVPGHVGALVLGHSHGVPLAVLQGRVHYYEGHALQQVVFPVRVMGQLGVTTLVLTNAAGAVNPAYAPGELMIVEDHVNLIGNPLVGPNTEALGPRFPDMSEAYDRRLRDLAESACAALGIRARRGVYLALSGPSYETPAEIRMARTLGADAVGMSTAPEVVAARHMGMRVLALSCISNLAAGISTSPLDHHEVLANSERMRASLLAVLDRIVARVAEEA
jgi:purine-nucleoside phosphorylase